MEDPRKLRELAGWYREFAERAGSPAIWHARLVTAEDLEREADRLEKVATRDHVASRRGTVEQDKGSLSNSGSEHCNKIRGSHYEAFQPLRRSPRSDPPPRQ